MSKKDSKIAKFTESITQLNEWLFWAQQSALNFRSELSRLNHDLAQDMTVNGVNRANPDGSATHIGIALHMIDVKMKEIQKEINSIQGRGMYET